MLMSLDGSSKVMNTLMADSSRSSTPQGVYAIQVLAQPTTPSYRVALTRLATFPFAISPNASKPSTPHATKPTVSPNA